MIHRIQTKITITYLFLTLLAVVAFALIAGLASERSQINQKTQELSRRIDILAPLLIPEAGDSSLSTLHRHIRGLSLAMGTRITLLDSEGAVIVDSDVPVERTGAMENHLERPEIQSALTDSVGVSKRRSATVNQDFLYVAKMSAVPDAEGVLRRLHIIRLSAPLETIQSMAREERNNLLFAGSIALALITAVSLYVSRRISKPMVSIAEAIERIRAGNLETRIEVQSNDEVGRVAQAVNEMVDTLKSDILRLKKLERVRSEFLGNISHELRTPIFSLQGFLETLLEGALDDPAVNRDFVKKAYHHSQRLNTLLGELITISQIESGEMKMSFRYFNLFEFLEDTLAEFRPTAEHYGVTLSLNESLRRDIQVLGDKERLRVVFENLLENAIKYNSRGGIASVSCRKDGDAVTISVSDTGLGIAQEHHPRIFERFYRVDKDRSREVGGTGLGLAIVKHIVEAHGSSVTVESAVGKGSTFSFALKS